MLTHVFIPPVKMVAHVRAIEMNSRASAFQVGKAKHVHKKKILAKILHAEMVQNVSAMWTMSSSIVAVLKDMKEKLVKRKYFHVIVLLVRMEESVQILKTPMSVPAQNNTKEILVKLELIHVKTTLV